MGTLRDQRCPVIVCEQFFFFTNSSTFGTPMGPAHDTLVSMVLIAETVREILLSAR